MDKAWTYILAAAAALLGGRAGAAAQGDSTATVPSPQVRLSAPRLRARADSLRRTYRFAEAVELYRQAQEAARDSSVRQALEEDLALARNGLSMSAFCSQPVVVARQRFSLSDFFLFYPLEDKAWRPVPNVLDSLGAASPARAMYVPAGADKLIYSAADEDGIHNLYRTERKDSVWTAPELLGEDHTSPGNEVFPMLSADGKALYFSSAGLYGMGGYDLYVSRWNEETRDWDAPVNLGFPYSSPFDDFLFVNTPDGKYSMFASNRDCSPDSVYLYVLEYDSMPVRKAVSDPEALAGLAALLPEEDPARMDNGAVASSGQDDVDTRRYSEKMASVRALRDSVYACGRGIDRARAALMEAAEEDKAGLAARILADETQLAALQEALAKATKELQDIEMEFLMSGVVIDPEKLQQEADREVVGAASGYVFSRSSMGPALQMTVQRPKPSFDYAFMVLPEGRFAEDHTLPAGLVYQIQLFSMSTRATVRHLKGLSPVFERQAAGKYIYSAGLFRTYKDVLANLNKVRKAGFKTAFIVAFEDGKSLSVNKAREREKTVHPLQRIRIWPEDGKSLGEAFVNLIHSVTDADLSKEQGDGGVSYLLGPFEEADEARAVAEALKTGGMSRVSIEEIPAQ